MSAHDTVSTLAPLALSTPSPQPATEPPPHRSTETPPPAFPASSLSSLPPCEIPPAPNPQPSTDFQRLAALAPVDYDHVRKAEAKRLNLRLATLDAEVDRCRASNDDIEAEARALDLLSCEPWPEPITDPPALFDQVHQRFPLYLYLRPGVPVVFTLWAAHSHAIQAFTFSPRLNLWSTKPGRGKSTAFDVLAILCPKALRTENLKTAVLFRVVHHHQPTLFLDEVDAYLHLFPELRGLLNAGNNDRARVYRCEGHTVRSYKLFAATALAGLGHLDPTLHDRSIVITLDPAPPGALPAQFNPKAVNTEAILARKIARWTSDNFDAIAAAKPVLPPTAYNRVADKWRPLFKLAHVIGAHWPNLALQAYNSLTPLVGDDVRSLIPPSGQAGLVAPNLPTEAGLVAPKLPSEGGSPSFPLLPSPTETSLLLSDLRQIFESSLTDCLPSKHLVAALCSMPNRPWSWRQSGNKPITVSWLGRRLASLGITPRNIRINGIQTKAYLLAEVPWAPKNPEN